MNGTETGYTRAELEVIAMQWDVDRCDREIDRAGISGDAEGVAHWRGMRESFEEALEEAKKTRDREKEGSERRG